MKVLIVALDAQIRHALEQQFVERGRLFQTVGEEWLDADIEAVADDALLAIPSDIDLVVNAVTFECLQWQQCSDRVLDRTLQLAKACERAEIPLLQLSSARVFDGLDSGRHRESEAPVPASQLAITLSRTEALLQENTTRHLILRAGLLFSPAGNNIFTSLLDDIKALKPLVLSSRRQFCPVHTEDLARVISAIIDQLSCGCDAWGIYHYSSSDSASSYQFVESVLAAVGQFQENIDPSQHLRSLVKEADQASCELLPGEEWRAPLLNCDKIRNTFGIKQLSWRAFIVPTVKSSYLGPLYDVQPVEEISSEQE